MIYNKALLSALPWLSGGHWSIFRTVAPKRWVIEKVMFTGNMSELRANYLRCHSHSAVVNNKPCRSVSLHVPGRPTDRPIDRPAFCLRPHNSKTLWPISIIQVLSVNFWDVLGPGFVKRSSGTMSMVDAFSLHSDNSKLLIDFDHSKPVE